MSGVMSCMFGHGPLIPTCPNCAAGFHAADAAKLAALTAQVATLEKDLEELCKMVCTFTSDSDDTWGQTVNGLYDLVRRVRGGT